MFWALYPKSKTRKPRNTEIWVRNFKNPRNIVQITSKLQWFSHTANHAAAIWVLKAFDPSEHFKLSPFSFMSVLILKQLKSGQNTGPHALECYKPENKIFRDFQVFVLCPIPNNENSEIPKIHQKPQNTEMWVCNFKNSLNTVQTTSISKWSKYTFTK